MAARVGKAEMDGYIPGGAFFIARKLFSSGVWGKDPVRGGSARTYCSPPRTNSNRKIEHGRKFEDLGDHIGKKDGQGFWNFEMNHVADPKSRNSGDRKPNNKHPL